MSNIAVILAGGVGQRFGADIPKQFIRVAGKPILEHTLSVFESNESTDKILVMVVADHEDETKNIITKGNFSKVSKVLVGGKTRNETSLLALNEVTDDDLILFHDAVRPFVNDKILDEAYAALENGAQAIDVAIPSADTIIKVDDVDSAQPIIEDIPERKFYYLGQTPQGFQGKIIKEAYKLYQQKPNSLSVTDDCGVVKHFFPEVPIQVIEGASNNIKITNKNDLFVADQIFQMPKGDLKLSHKFTSLKDKVVVIFGGNKGIGSKISQIMQDNGAHIETFSRSINNIDISEYKDVEKAKNTVIEKCGKVDIVINCAAVLENSNFEDLTAEQINKNVGINFLGATYMANIFYKDLEKTNGSLVFFSSSSYTRGRKHYALYSAAKAGIVNLTQGLSEEWENKIRVNCVVPERTSTGMRTSFATEEVDILSATEVAKATVALSISKHSGQILNVKKVSVIS